MTSRPEFRGTSGLAPALAAVGVFAVMAAVFIGAPLGPNEGFPATQETVNESLGDASIAENASIQATDNGTIAVIQTVDGNESTTLTDDEGANASIVTAGGQTYGVVTDPVSITATIGYAMFGLGEESRSGVPAENFLVLFELIAMVLVAALVGAVMLARREEPGVTVALFASDDDAADPATDAVAADGGTNDGAHTGLDGRTGDDRTSDDGPSSDDGGDA
jgi:NADH-quinone oxidoreductase subunit J